MIPFPQKHSIDVLPLRGKTKTAPREPFSQPAIALYVRRSVHLTLNLTPLPRLSIFGTILIPGPPREPPAGGFRLAVPIAKAG